MKLNMGASERTMENVGSVPYTGLVLYPTGTETGVVNVDADMAM